MLREGFEQNVIFFIDRNVSRLSDNLENLFSSVWSRCGVWRTILGKMVWAGVNRAKEKSKVTVRHVNFLEVKKILRDKANGMNQKK